MMAVLICVFAASAHAAQISVEPAYHEAFQGDNITVDIMVYPEESGIYGASYTLYFNNTILNATSQTRSSGSTEPQEHQVQGMIYCTTRWMPSDFQLIIFELLP